MYKIIKTIEVVANDGGSYRAATKLTWLGLAYLAKVNLTAETELTLMTRPEGSIQKGPRSQE